MALNSSAENYTVKAMTEDYRGSGWMRNETPTLNESPPMGDFEEFVYIMSKYLIPIVIFGGLGGNTLCLIVFLGSHLRLLNCYLYLAFMNAADSVYLLCQLTSWLGWWQIYLFHKQGWCQIIIYASYVSSFCSTWTVAIFTVERYLVVHFPMKRQTLCTRSKALLSIALLAIIPLVLFSFSLITNGIVVHPVYGEVCMAFPQYDYFSRIVTAVDTFITWILPGIVIIVCNCMIVFKIRKALFNADIPSDVSRSSLSSTTSLQREFSCSVRRRRQHNQTTKALLVVSTVFLVLNLPYYSIRFYMVIHYLVNTDSFLTDNLQRAQHILQFCSHLNHAINFLLYSACSRAFSRAFGRMKSRWNRTITRKWISFRTSITRHRTQEET